MTTPYYVDLFYEDIGFTNDYSNVLQFNSKEEREAYFDNIAHYRMENTEFNNMNIEGNSVKLAFYDLQSVDLDEINYIRIATKLYGTTNTIDTLEYGFIIDYSVISSAENCTVVEFVFEKDIWMNYQFNFNLKECNVERSHMDRWDIDGKVIYNTPSYDSVDSYMKKLKSIEDKKEEHIYIDASGNTRKINYGIVCIAYMFGDAENHNEHMQFIYFPVDLDTETREISGFLADYTYNGTTINIKIKYPSLQSVLDGTYVVKMGLTPSRVKNAFIICDTILAPNRLTNLTVHAIVGISTEVDITGIGNLVGKDSGYVQVIFSYPNPLRLVSATTEVYGYCTTQDDAPYPWNDDYEITIDLSKPVMPTDGDNYSYTHEPMMYKSPVMKRYISSFDGSTFMNIPDVKLNLGNGESNKLRTIAFIDYANGGVVVSVNPENIEDKELASNNIVANSVFIPAIQCDILNNAWEDYVNTTRNMDRQAMWLNIATAGLADVGSTGISAGIGYRANMERANIANIQRSQLDGRTRPARALKQTENMYAGYAKQAAAMSIVGGIAQFGAGALGSYFGQEIKESAVKNTPGTLTKIGNLGSIIYTGFSCNLEIVEMICDDVSFKKYEDIFKKFGYAICGVITPNIKSRKYFNYIKTNGAILTGNVNQAILANLAVLFDKGMTIWHMDYTTKETIYDYTKENIERSLISNERCN